MVNAEAPSLSTAMVNAEAPSFSTTMWFLGLYSYIQH
jgi:hypothetical protein